MSVDVTKHPRVQALSPDAREMYLALLERAAPDGTLVHKRIANMVQIFGPQVLWELLSSDLLAAEWYVVSPVTLDRAEAFEAGDAP